MRSPNEFSLTVGAALLGNELEFTEGPLTITIDYIEGDIVSIEKCSCGDINLVNSLAMPTLINSHAHVLDLAIAEEGWDLDIDSVVGEPYGLKYILLRKLPKEVLIRAINSFMKYSLSIGVGGIIEFRELGGYGISLGRSEELMHYMLFMPSSHNRESIQELNNFISFCDGLGISSPHYFSSDVLKELINVAKIQGKLVISHIAETKDVREESDFERIIKISKPDALVHGYWLSNDDLLTIKDLGITLIICPRSALWFLSGEPNIKSLYELGINVCLGTDNAGWISPNLWREMELLSLLMRKYCGLVDAKWVLRTVTVNPLHLLNKNNYLCEGCKAYITLINIDELGLRSIRNKYLGIVKRGGYEVIDAVIINGKVTYDRWRKFEALRNSIRN